MAGLAAVEEDLRQAGLVFRELEIAAAVWAHDFAACPGAFEMPPFRSSGTSGFAVTLGLRLAWAPRGPQKPFAFHAQGTLDDANVGSSYTDVENFPRWVLLRMLEPHVARDFGVLFAHLMDPYVERLPHTLWLTLCDEYRALSWYQWGDVAGRTPAVEYGGANPWSELGRAFKRVHRAIRES